MLTDYNEYLEGVKIWYNGTSLNWRNSSEEITILDSSQVESCSNGSLTNVDNSGSSSYVLSGLLPYTQYDIFLMPYYKMLLGKPSNSMIGYTDEDGEFFNNFIIVYSLYIHNILLVSNNFSATCSTPKRDSGCN